MNHRIAYVSALLSLATFGSLAAAEQVTSPDGQLVVTVDLKGGQLAYSADWQGESLVEKSLVQLENSRQKPLGWNVAGSSTNSIDETWSPLVGKQQTVSNHCQELVVKLKRSLGTLTELEFVVRAYDDGFAYRWRVPQTVSEDDIWKLMETATFDFTGNPSLWSYQKERQPLGPIKLSAAQGKLSPPVLLQLEEGRFAAIHEANLKQSAWLELQASGGVIETTNNTNRIIETASPYQTPWRVVMVGNTLSELVDSNLLPNLNPKADPEEFAWVKPGVALWDWRSWGYNAPDGFKFGLNLASWKRFIDFAAAHDIPYILLDANWYGPEMEKSSNPFTGGVASDVKTAIEYGKQHDVGLILYLNDVAGREYGIEKILRTWSDWGAAGIKYGFMKSQTPQEKVAWTRKIVTLCAENHLLVNFHDGPVPPAGDEAALPNWVTREFCHAQSDSLRVFTPSTFLMMMAVNQLAGPIDMNNGMFDLNKSVAERPRVFDEVPATITSEAARTLIVYSGMTVIPDATPVYERHPELFKFISAQQMPWTQSKTLDFKLGKSISVMRQSGENFLVASATNEEGRLIKIPLDFLPAGKQYTALVCEDAAEAHYKTNREAYETRTMDVDSETVVEAKLAPGGGHCLLIEPQAN